MASSGYMDTSNQYVKYWIDVTQNSQNIANNTSNVTVKVFAKRTNTGYTTWGSGSVTLKVNGTYYNTGTFSISITSTTVQLHSWTGNISHNSDGSKSLTCSAAVNIPTVLSSSEQSYTQTLSTIPRTSSFTLSKSSCELGSSFVVNISRASSSFTHAVSYMFAGSRRYIQAWNGTGTSLTHSPSMTYCNNITNATSTSVTIDVETYSGGTLIGTSSKSITFTIPASVVPSFSSIKVERVDNYVPAAWGMYIQSKSQAKLTIDGVTEAYGSKIKSYSISGGGYSGTTQTLTTGVLNSSGTNTFTATITDYRGRSATKTVPIYVEPYAPPKVTAVEYYRSNGTSTEVSDGSGIWIKVTTSHTSITSKNQISIQVASLQNMNGDKLLVEKFLTSGVGMYLGSVGLNPDEQYKIQLVVADSITTLPTQWHTVMTEYVTMDFLKSGKGVAIGKVATSEGFFDVNMQGWFRNNLTTQGTLQVRSGLQNSSSYEDGAGYYHNTDGCLVSTNISSGLSVMFELYISGNSYSSVRPIDMQVNGYVYDGDIIYRSCHVNSYDIPINVFFMDGRLHFWMKQMSNHNTLRFKLCTSTGVSYPSYTVTNAPMPTTGVTKKYTFSNVVEYNTLNAHVIVDEGTNANGKFIRYSDGTQICYKTFTQGISNFVAWGNIWESYNFSLGSWAAQFKTNTKPVISAQCGQSAFVGWVTTCYNSTNTAIGNISICRATNALNTTAIIYVVGYGVWK